MLKAVPKKRSRSRGPHAPAVYLYMAGGRLPAELDDGHPAGPYQNRVSSESRLTAHSVFVGRGVNVSGETVPLATVFGFPRSSNGT